MSDKHCAIIGCLKDVLTSSSHKTKWLVKDTNTIQNTNNIKIVDGNLMKTSISREALTQFGAEKITFPPKCDGRTDIRKYEQTDKGSYRVASLLKWVIQLRNKFLCVLKKKRKFV